ncbi:MAG: TrmH family RNA methyltransferase [Planctomycetota bacterium]
MPKIRINSPEDPRIAPYVDLRDRALGKRGGRFIAEGELVVQRLLESRFAVESLLVAEPRLHRLEVPPGVPVYYAPRGLIEEIVGFRFHRGILGCGVREPAGHWAPRCPGVAKEALAVVCSAIRDPVNLGGILRNCAAFGVDLVLIGNRAADPYSRRALRVSMAAALKLNIGMTDDLPGDVTRLREEFGFDCVASVLDSNARPLAATPRPRRLALVLGNEYDGVEAPIQQACATTVTIPMRLGTDSLNVAVSAGVLLYHFTQLAPRNGLI